MASSLVDAVIAHFDSVFAGPNGDYPAVMEALAGVTAEQALWKPAPSQNSIWQIVEHLIASKEWQIDMLHGKNPSSPVWIKPSGDDNAWQATLARLKEGHQRLKAVLEEIPEAELLKAPEGEPEGTLLGLILSSGPAHEAHHSGQIDYLRGLHASSA